MPSLHFSESGKGSPIVFLHGFCETQEIWKEFIKPLADTFHIYAIDLPGFGGSELLPAPFTIDQVGDAVARALVKNKISDCLVVGHSLGGYVTLSLVDRYPGLIKGFGLFHSTSFTDTPEKKENRNKVIEFVKKNGVQPYIDTFVPGLFFDKENNAVAEVHRIASQTCQETLIGYLQAMRDRPDRSQILRNHEKFKFIIAGREDALMPPELSHKMAGFSQNCRFFELENVGHMGIFESQTSCRNVIQEFAEELFNNK